MILGNSNLSGIHADKLAKEGASKEQVDLDRQCDNSTERQFLKTCLVGFIHKEDIMCQEINKHIDKFNTLSRKEQSTILQHRIKKNKTKANFSKYSNRAI